MAEADLESLVEIPQPLEVVVTNIPDVNVTDRCARLLGQICVANSPIDPRAIRALTFLTDSVDVSGSIIDISDRCSRLLGQLCGPQGPIDPRDRNWTLDFKADQVDVTGSLVDISDRCARLLGQLCVKGSAIDPRDRNWRLNCYDQIDVCDRADRLVGIVYGNLTQLQQKPVSFELLTDPVDRCDRLLGQLCAPQGGAIDPRDRNWSLDFDTDQVDATGSTVSLPDLYSFTEGGQTRLVVTDDETTNLLAEILKELRKNNMYLSKMTDMYIKNADIIND